VTDRLLERELRRLEAPGEGDAALRAWEVASAEFERMERVPAAPRPRRWLRPALVGGAALAGLAALVISPAGATVSHWVAQRFTGSPGVKHARPALVSLPSGGHLLVSSRDGTWVVAPDGSKRRIGPYRDATWSPHGLYVAAVRGNDLVAVDPRRGQVQWALPRLPRPALPSWSPGDGFRVAYLTGSILRVVAGDGTGDHPLATRVASVAPAWRPGRAHVVSYWTRAGRIVTRDADTGRVLWRASAGDSSPGSLQWSPLGRVLMVRGPHRLELLDGRTGTVLKLLTTGTGLSFASAEISPDGGTIALARFDSHAGSSEIFLLRVGTRGWNARRVFGPGAGRFDAVRWSPDGRWLLVTWPAAGQWLFLRTAPLKGLRAVSGIGRAFEPDRRGPARFPSAGGWCCAP
jgi:hypothetical protein